MALRSLLLPTLLRMLEGQEEQEPSGYGLVLVHTGAKTENFEYSWGGFAFSVSEATPALP